MNTPPGLLAIPIHFPMKQIGLLLLAVSALAFSASAQTFKLPDDKPIVSIDIPKSWEPVTYDDGVEATSDDGEVYLAVEATSAKGVKDSIEEAVKYLMKKGVKIKADSMKQETAKVNGMDMVDLSWDGTDKDGACKVSLTILGVTDDKGIMIIYWASPEGEKKHQADLNKIAKSIVKLKKGE